MTPQEHYAAAEKLMEKADSPSTHPEGARHLLQMAQVHATLATFPPRFLTVEYAGEAG